jgi:dienelactone hydrolase
VTDEDLGGEESRPRRRESMRATLTRPRRYAAVLVATAALLLAGCRDPGGGGGGGGTPGPGGLQKGPSPTALSLNAARGPFAIAQQRSGVVSGFGGGTIWYPTDTSQGTFGAIVVVPGFISGRSSVSWYGPRLASHGFVVMVIDTLTPLDFPAQRAAEQNAALRWLSEQSPVKNRIDPNRLGAMGWSMGGGGSLEASRNAKIKAAVPMAPWDIASFPLNDTPTLVVACQGDIVAPPALMAKPFYQSINAREKAYLGVPNVTNHFCVTTPSDLIARYAIAWMKRFIDEDTRYNQFICNRPPAPAEYMSTCPT